MVVVVVEVHLGGSSCERGVSHFSDVFADRPWFGFQANFFCVIFSQYDNIRWYL